MNRAVLDRRIAYVFTVAMLAVAVWAAIMGDAVAAVTFGFIGGIETERSIGLWAAHRYDRTDG